MATERRFYGGSHKCEGRAGGTYDLRVDDAGIISCGECGASDLLPETEAARAARGHRGGLDRYAARHAREVLSGKRGRIGSPVALVGVST